MPQICTEGYPSPALPGTSTYEMTSFGRSEGRLGVDGSTIALRNNPQGVIAGIAKVFSRTEAPRRTPEAENKHIAALPKVATDKILAYLADPFERATLAMTCRLLYRQLKPYWPEFQLFRDLIASKKSLDFRSQSSCMREVTLWLNLLTGDRWISWRAKAVFVEMVKRLGRMHPRIPERVFHELWPLFDNLTNKAKLEVLHEVFQHAMARSPYWAITVLSEFARRTVYGGVKPEFHDTLLRLATPLLLNTATAKFAEPLIGAIAQAQRLGGDTRSWDEARWKRILQLLPPSTPINSPAVLGLANTAIDIQYRWEKHGKKFEHGFPAVAMMQERFKGFPTYAAIKKSAIPVYLPEEKEINERRQLRYMATSRYAVDRARSDRLHKEIAGAMYARSSAPWLETAGGG
ncbi:hypothetical protein B551_0209190 [Cupriavidus sp. HPC(L)]|uniref:hypothetical protein n=1 Tax=Cupriavidus sp. HPC(L) TaxID=1217418 RepID=UPI0003BF8E39|nr:hypothetical protein [Cupriavidus sp. HPC(L)]ESJ21134.1 hypothetical protein B551_0209190 [Cupriavidus sp. HPC(L)]